VQARQQLRRFGNAFPRRVTAFSTSPSSALLRRAQRLRLVARSDVQDSVTGSVLLSVMRNERRERNGVQLLEQTDASDQQLLFSESELVPQRPRKALEGLRNSAEPMFGPMVTPPLPWRAPDCGAYHASARSTFRVGLMRSKGSEQRSALAVTHASAPPLDDVLQAVACAAPEHSAVTAVAEADLQAQGGAQPRGLALIYEALDALGAQSWRIHSGVLQVRHCTRQAPSLDADFGTAEDCWYIAL
jgi:DNA-directed RNA polymerase N-terminal